MFFYDKVLVWLKIFFVNSAWLRDGKGAERSKKINSFAD